MKINRKHRYSFLLLWELISILEINNGNCVLSLLHILVENLFFCFRFSCLRRARYGAYSIWEGLFSRLR